MYKYTGSFDFAVLRANAGLIPLGITNIAFILMFIGFGTKAGIIPFHIWLPSAHPAAPSHISGLMSGVMIKTGIFMMIRFFFDIFGTNPLWWGLSILIIGSISSLLGVLYAITEHDIKRLLAYHSIENIGIILLGLGSALTFNSLQMPELALLALTASLFHILNHAIFKSLLFLSAGSVINQTHTRNMEEYGGLIKYMPQTALFFLIGSMAISALPPFNGFFSEWFTFQSLFQGIISSGSYVKLVFMISAGALAFTGGLALLCFVKAFGSIFLARPRSEEVLHAKESGFFMKFGMAGLATLSLLFGVFSGALASIIGKVAQSLYIGTIPAQIAEISSTQKISVGNFSSVSGLAIFTALIVTALIVFLISKYLVYEKQKVIIGATWDCGTDLTPRMETTATGFARTIILMWKGVLRPHIEKNIEYVEGTTYVPKSKEIIMGIKDLYSEYIYEPIIEVSVAISDRIKEIQNGNLSSYILYIFAVLITLLFFTTI
jgi:hydrogenase-4 component B